METLVGAVGIEKAKLLELGLCPQCVASTAALQLEQTEQTSGEPAVGVRQAWDSGTVLTQVACAEELIGGGGSLIHS